MKIPLRLVTLGYAFYLVQLMLNGDLYLFLRPSYHVLVFLAAFALLVLGLAAHRILSSPGESGIEWLRGAFILFPLVYGLIVPPALLGAGDASGLGGSISTGAAAPGEIENLATGRGSDEPLELRMTQLVRIASLSDPRLDSMPIRISGWVMEGSGGRRALMRYMIFCCVADAMPQGVELETPPGFQARENEWIEVEGRLGPSEGARRRLVVESWKEIPRPVDPYALR